MSNTDWCSRFLEMAALVASWSKDPKKQCGAVVVRPDRTVASVGFNGFPRGLSDSPELYYNQELKLSRVIHAEVNAVLHAREPIAGYTLYSWPPGFGPTCDRCAAVIIQSGITRVVYRRDLAKEFTSSWAEPGRRALAMYAEAGVSVFDAGMP